MYLSLETKFFFLTGIVNPAGHKFILKEYSFFPDEHVLNFGRDYSQLHDGGVGELHNVPLGRRSMLHGVHALSWHNPEMGDPTIVWAQARLGVCRFALMVSESLRLIPIRETFAPVFDSESFATHEDCELVHIWGEASKQLLRWNDGKPFDVNNRLQRAHINDATTAPKKVDIILRKYK
jgi:hypothetical protein